VRPELPQDETALRQVIYDLQSHGEVLVVVEQPNTIRHCRSRSLGIVVPRLRICPVWPCTRPLSDLQDTTVAQVGEVSGVSRSTIYRALRRDPGFVPSQHRRSKTKITGQYSPS